MTIEELHYDFKMKMDKGDSSKKRNFLTHEIDWILNEAQLIFIKQRFGQRNSAGLGFETTSKRKKDLNILHIKSPQLQPSITPAELSDDSFEVNLKRLKFEPYIITRVQADISKDGCVKRASSLKPVQHDDLNEYLIRSFNRPDFTWGRVIYTSGKSTDLKNESIYLHTRNFNVDKVYVDYLKAPQKVWFGNYDTLDGKLRVGVDSKRGMEFNSIIQNEIVDVAVRECSRIIENPDFMNLKSIKVQENEIN